MQTRSIFRTLAAFAAALALPAMAQSADGVVLIDQARAEAGAITGGDAPGFPVTISQPGSYRLAGTLRVAERNTDAILIATSDVTLDLNGFAIIGPTLCSSPLPVSCNIVSFVPPVVAWAIGSRDAA